MREKFFQLTEHCGR